MATFLRLMFQTDSFCFFVQSYRFRNNHIYIILEKSFISLLMFQTYINKVNGRWSIGSEAWGQREIVHFELLVTTTYIIVYQHFKNIIYFKSLFIIKIYYFCDVLWSIFINTIKKDIFTIIRKALFMTQMLPFVGVLVAPVGEGRCSSGTVREKCCRDKTMMILSRKHFQSLILQWISLHHPQLSQRPRPVRER